MILLYLAASGCLAALVNFFRVRLEQSNCLDVIMKTSQDERREKNKNPHIKDMKEDVLYHIGLSSGSQDLKAMFGDVKVSKLGINC
jgi:hypothetical protein